MTFQALIVAALAAAPQTHTPQFSDFEKRQIVAYWSEPGRYTVGPPVGTDKTGPYVVRLTPEASTWFWKYNRKRGLGKTAPSVTPAAQNAQQNAWETWIDAKVARDRWVAGKRAEKLNKTQVGSTPTLADTVEPDDPGPIPDGLRALVGDPPPFAACVQPKQHTIVFDPNLTLTYQDCTPMRPRYAYFRFSQGVMSGGNPVKRLPEAEMTSLFEDAGITPFERKVMGAVSALEGGFDSINTYDTGFVSVGLIQFACLQAGSGSLGKLLLTYKNDDPQGFQADFRAFGVDVDATGTLVVLDPTTGEELAGRDAARKIIDEPRLAAVFQRAGKVSRPFRVAQIQAAKEQYYPAEDVVTFTLGAKTVSAKVSDIIKTEAGMATLMDRKVNTGKIDPFSAVLTRIAAEKGANTIQDLATYEYEITAAMRYRNDYLSDRILAQPDRHGMRSRSHRRAGSSGG